MSRCLVATACTACAAGTAGVVWCVGIALVRCLLPAAYCGFTHWVHAPRTPRRRTRRLWDGRAACCYLHPGAAAARPTRDAVAHPQHCEVAGSAQSRRGGLRSRLRAAAQALAAAAQADSGEEPAAQHGAGTGSGDTRASPHMATAHCSGSSCCFWLQLSSGSPLIQLFCTPSRLEAHVSARWRTGRRVGTSGSARRWQLKRRAAAAAVAAELRAFFDHRSICLRPFPLTGSVTV